VLPVLANRYVGRTSTGYGRTLVEIETNNGSICVRHAFVIFPRTIAVGDCTSIDVGAHVAPNQIHTPHGTSAIVRCALVDVFAGVSAINNVDAVLPIKARRENTFVNVGARLRRSRPVDAPLVNRAPAISRCTLVDVGADRRSVGRVGTRFVLSGTRGRASTDAESSSKCLVDTLEKLTAAIVRCTLVDVDAFASCIDDVDTRRVNSAPSIVGCAFIDVVTLVRSIRIDTRLHTGLAVVFSGTLVDVLARHVSIDSVDAGCARLWTSAVVGLTFVEVLASRRPGNGVGARFENRTSTIGR
jgi:hypothetical protein